MKIARRLEQAMPPQQGHVLTGKSSGPSASKIAAALVVIKDPSVSFLPRGHSQAWIFLVERGLPLLKASHPY